MPKIKSTSSKPNTFTWLMGLFIVSALSRVQATLTTDYKYDQGDPLATLLGSYQHDPEIMTIGSFNCGDIEEGFRPPGMPSTVVKQNNPDLASYRLPNQVILSDKQAGFSLIPLDQFDDSARKSLYSKHKSSRFYDAYSLETRFVESFIHCVFGKQAEACEVAGNLIKDRSPGLRSIGSHDSDPHEEKYATVDGSRCKALKLRVSLFKHAKTLKQADGKVEQEKPARQEKVRQHSSL